MLRTSTQAVGKRYVGWNYLDDKPAHSYIYAGALRDEQRRVVWKCEHVHENRNSGRDSAEACAAVELLTVDHSGQG